MADCFPNGGKGVASAYPRFDIKTRQIVTLEASLVNCLQLNKEPVIDLTDEEQLGPISAYLRSLAAGQSLAVRVDSALAREKFLLGKDLFWRRLGNFDLSCGSCHVRYAGAIYFGDNKNVSLAPAVGMYGTWPHLKKGGVPRLIQMQFQQCMRRIGAQPFDVGSNDYNNLEYYIAYLSGGLPISTLVAE